MKLDRFQLIIIHYTSLGILFGALFPLCASLLEISFSGGEISAHWFLMVQRMEPLLWIIDTAPFFLGIFAFLAGSRQAKAARLAAGCANTVTERTLELEALNIALAREVDERKNAQQVLKDANGELEVTIQRLEQHNREADLLNAMGEMFQNCLRIEEAYSIAGHFAGRLFEGIPGALYIFVPKRELLEEVAHWGGIATGEAVFHQTDCWGLRRGRIYITDDARSSVRCRHLSAAVEDGDSPSICIPMTAQGDTVGLLVLRIPLGQPVDAWTQLAATMADRIAPALTSLRLAEILHNQSIRDPLTGLFNRRYLEDALERAFRLAARSQGELSVVFIDIDHFKQFNDMYGHETGDLVLKSIGSHLLANFRCDDIPCRFGGEEFCLIMPNASAEVAALRVEAMRAQLEGLALECESKPIHPVTVSVGVAEYNLSVLQPGDLLKQADLALYQAKQMGRNRVVVFEKSEFMALKT
jgi:diguanylate cyclase (GGDEF)-like protein